MTAAPTITEVRIREDHATGKPAWVVNALWSGVDRPDSYGISTGSNRQLAERLKRAIEAGVVFTNPTIRTDVNGKTYVSHNTAVVGRRLNADLARLGF